MAENGHPFPEPTGSVVRSLRPDPKSSADSLSFPTPHSVRADREDGERSQALLKDQLSEHKGKLAIGVAAMLGAAIFYKWRETQLAKVEPEEYARLQRLKDRIRERELHVGRDVDDDLLRSEDGMD